jgi:hypothetical protein
LSRQLVSYFYKNVKIFLMAFLFARVVLKHFSATRDTHEAVSTDPHTHGAQAQQWTNVRQSKRGENETKY